MLYHCMLCVALLMSRFVLCVCCESVRVTAILVWEPGEVWLRWVRV